LPSMKLRNFFMGFFYHGTTNAVVEAIVCDDSNCMRRWQQCFARPQA